MAQVKKKNANRKGLSPETKRTLGNVFKSIISNQSCIDGAKESPWWIAVIFLVISIALPVIPTLVNGTKAYGASFVASANYGADRGLANTSQYLHENGYEFKVEGGTMSFYKDGAPFQTDNNFVASDIIENNYNFLFYVTNSTGSEYDNLIKEITNTKYVGGSLEVFDESKTYPEGYTLYQPSYIVLGKSTMSVYLYKSGTTTQAASSYSGLTWNTMKKGDILVDVLNVDPELQNLKKTEAIFNKWKSIFNTTYDEARLISIRNITLIYTGVYAGLILFLGLLLFLLTRGKNNVFRSLSFFTCQKIAWWASFTPAVLGMIVGWIFSTNVIGQMGFIVFVSLRAMWLSMRQLRPM